MSTKMSSGRTIQEVKVPDFHENKNAGKPAVAQRLEQESQGLKAKKSELTKDQIAKELQEAERRRQQLLNEKVDTAKQLEGHGGLKRTGSKETL